MPVCASLRRQALRVIVLRRPGAPSRGRMAVCARSCGKAAGRRRAQRLCGAEEHRGSGVAAPPGAVERSCSSTEGRLEPD